MQRYKKIILLGLVFIFCLRLLSLFADSLLLYAPSFPYADALLQPSGLPKWQYSWANFDGVHYITIVQQGYLKTDLIQAFFPVFPILVWMTTLLLKNTIIAGLLISNISIILLLLVLFKLISSELSKKIAWITVFALLAFPTSFFFTALYSESTFLLFVLLAFWFSKQKKYYLTALMIALASGTRVVGIVLLPAIWLDILLGNMIWDRNWKEYIAKISRKLQKWQKHSQPLLITSLGATGLLAYMAYLQYHFQDPFYFFSVQSEFGGGVRQETLITYPQVLYRYLKILLTVEPITWKYYSYVQDFVFATLGLFAILYSATKTRLSYVFFALVTFTIPTLTGTFSSLPRYFLIAFPVYILLAHWADSSRLFRYTWFTISILLLILNTVLFLQGYWVA